MSVTTTQLEEILKISLMTPARTVGYKIEEYTQRYGLTLLLSGPPGIGKTETLQALAAQLQMLCYTFKTESLQPSDLEGVLVGVGDGRVRRATDNEVVLAMLEVGEGIIIIDEINTRSEKLDGAIRRLFLDGVFAGRKLPGGVRVFCTTNPPDVSMSGSLLSPPLANAMAHLELEPHSKEEWLGHVSNPTKTFVGKADLSEMQERLRKGWAASYEIALSRFSLYLNKNATQLHLLPEQPEHRAGAWPSERSNTLALNAMTTCLALGASQDVEEALVAACIGTTSAQLLYKSIKDTLLPTTEDVLNNRWAPDPNRADIVYVVEQNVRSYAERHLPKQVTPAGVDLAYKVWRFAKQVHDQPALQDRCASIFRLLTAAGYGPMLRATGISKGANRRMVEDICGWCDEISKSFPYSTGVLR
jgi:hypothetical protein